ncbi:hypothetical protein Tco_0946166 [Tanacetum coccineum]
MTSITAQQTKLDLELVPKENQFDIGKCNGRIPRGFSPREPTFQVVLDALALTPCYPAFLITADGRDFDPLPSEEDIVSFLRDLGHTRVINSLNDVVVDQMHQPWISFAAPINRSLSGKTTGLDKLRLSRAQIIWGEVPPKAARKFKKTSPSKKDNIPVQADEEPVQKGKRVKRAAKKPLNMPATGIVIKEPTVETKSKGKEKKKTHPSGSGTVAEDPPRVAKITPTVTSEGTGEKPGVPDVTNDDSSESESESWGNDEDDSNNEQESSDESSKQENESEEHESDSEQDEESKDENQEEEEINQENEFKDDDLKSDEEQGMDDTTDQFDDGDKRLEEPTQTATDIVQETTQEQVVEDAHVAISTITKTNEVPVTSSSRSSDLASKFLNFSDIPHTNAEIVSPLDVPVHHKVPRTQAPTLLSIPVSVIPESSPVFTNIPQSSHTFTSTPILVTPTPPPTIETTNPLSNLPDFSFVFRFNDRISALEKEVAELKKDPLHTQVTTVLHGKNQRASKRSDASDSATGSSVQSEEPVFKVAYSDMPHDQEGNLGDNEDEPRKETASKSDWFKKPTPTQEPTDPDWNDFDELMSTTIDFSSFVLNGLKINNLTQEILLGPAFRLLKGTRSNYAELEYNFEECYKALSEKRD